MEPFLGEIKMWPSVQIPQGWHLCDGSCLPIEQNQALFALLGTVYGGDGVRNFALPDLRGRVPLSQGQGAGLTTRVLGESGGSERVGLTVTQTPVHAHTLSAMAGEGNTNAPTGKVWAANTANIKAFCANVAAPLAVMSPNALSQAAGGGQDHDNVMPSLVVNYIIALQGIFPMRS
jgi:microcystin-dependent protein